MDPVASVEDQLEATGKKLSWSQMATASDAPMSVPKPRSIKNRFLLNAKLRMPNKARNTSPGNLPARNLLDPCRRPTEGDACGLQRNAAG
jgi:hypothetical protein